MTWGNVDWERKRLHVRLVKTERYAGHERRTVPIAPALMQLLQDAFDAASEGQERVISLSRNNIRRTMHGIITRAGLTPWSDLSQTLYRSCATEWKQTYPAYAVDTWLGHSERVSKEHYLMIPDQLWDRVSRGPDKVDKGAAQGAAEGPRNEAA